METKLVKIYEAISDGTELPKLLKGKGSLMEKHWDG